MINIEKQKERFKNHVAKLTDYGNVKILDFQEPGTSNYRIRFIFEEDFCRCHISGDLGELSATNYNNMTYEGFSDFVRDVGYFEQKIDCLSRKIYYYDEDKARKELKEIVEEYELLEEIQRNSIYDEAGEEEEAVDDWIDSVLEYFDDDKGISSKGYDFISEYIDDAWEIVGSIGIERTGILEVYMLAFKLATERLKGGL